MGRVMCVFAVFAATAGIAPAGALALGNDPGAASPSGTIYEIPLDSARSDAAPRDPGGAEAPTADQPVADSSIHSENGFGSSAQVPGVPAAGAKAKAKAKASTRAKQQGASTGTGAAGAGTPNTEALIGPAARAATPSSARAYVLLALAAGVALALGAAARLAARRR